MRHFISAVKQTLSGQRQISINLKFSLLMFCASLVHFCYACFFYSQHLSFLFHYNLLVIFLYIGNCILMYYGRYKLAALTTLGEIWLCCILFSLMLGWSTGFALFLLVLVPIIYYVSFSTSIFKHNTFTPTAFSVFSFLVFLICRYITQFYNPYYTDIAEHFILSMYLFNSVVAFSMAIVFSLFFLFEIRTIQTALCKQNQYLDKMANVDSLTLLWNRRSMNTFLSEAVDSYQKSRKEFSLILCDIDDFKHINDTYGHSCGDAVLTHIAKLICSCVRSDDFVCRWGGEEVLILIQGPVTVAEMLAERIRARIEQSPTLYEGKEIFHTMTFGVTAYLEGSQIEQSISAADSKLYDGKRQGKNQVNA